MILPNKHILVKIRLEKVDLGEVYIQKEQENFKKRSSSNTIWGPLHMSHPVCNLIMFYISDTLEKSQKASMDQTAILTATCHFIEVLNMI